MTNCRETRDALEWFLTGRLAGEESRRVRIHLGQCADCRSVLKDLDRIEVLTAFDPEIEPSADLAHRFKIKLAEHRERHARGAAPFFCRLISWRRPAGLAAIGALASLVAFAIYFGADSRPTPSPGVAIRTDLSIAENLPLLEDLGVIRNLDLLENLDAIENLSEVPGGGATVQ